MPTIATAAIVVTVFVLLVLAGILVTVAKLFRKVPQGRALVVSTMKEKVLVTFTGKVVLPIVHKAETMDISVKTIDIDRRGKDGLICRDNIRADISVKFFVRVNKDAADVVKVAQSIGCERASDPVILNELFNAKFAEALKTAGKKLDFEDLFTHRHEFRDHIMEVIGTDLNGYALEDVAIDYLEQTPLATLDSDNILDAQGIRKITERTAIEHIATNEARNEEIKAITKKDVETREATLELERQQADAEARQAREVATVRAREAAETARVEAEQRLMSEAARIETEQRLGVQQENLEREVAVAKIDRDRVVAVETENVEKARQVAVVAREVETTNAELALEQERARIAELRRERVAVEHTVAEKEEGIVTLRTVEDAKRHRDAKVIEAEADAQAGFVIEIKEAEAAESAAGHRAAERITLAKAAKDAAELEAAAKIRLAEGTQAEAAATGLAEAQVKTADAEATKAQGLAQVEIKAADAEAVKAVGMAEAVVVREAGAAEGEAVEARLRGEAAGTHEKAAALRELEGVGREFEEFRLDLEARTNVSLAEVDAQVGIAKAHAAAVTAGLEKANIDIVGGSELFVNQMLGAVQQGKRVDGVLDSSKNIGKVLAPYTNGDGNLLGDLAGALGGSGPAALQNLTVSAFLGQLMVGSTPEMSGKIGRVLEALEAEGIDQHTVADFVAK
jgi:uncharacterized membrane protein YqiK